MRASCLRSLVLPSMLAVGLTCSAGRLRADDRVQFNRDIRPILSENCYKCHGPDRIQRKAGLRLDKADGALAKLESGATAIVPGQPGGSELVRRITSADEGMRMPPPETGKKLTGQQID